MNNQFIFALLVAAFALGVTTQAEAAAISSAQTGNWGDTTTWVGGAVPGA